MLGTMFLHECSFLTGSNKLRILVHIQMSLLLWAYASLKFPNQAQQPDTILLKQIHQLTMCSRIIELVFSNLFVGYLFQQYEYP